MKTRSNCWGEIIIFWREIKCGVSSCSCMDNDSKLTMIGYMPSEIEPHYRLL